MNKRQKEVLQAQLDAEKAVLDQLEKHYKRALRDIERNIRILQSDELTQSRIYRIEHQKALKSQVEAIIEKLHADEYSTIQEFLTNSYTDAFVGAAYDMHGQGVPLIMPINPEEAVSAVMLNSKLSDDLYTSLGVDTKKLQKTVSAEISRGLAGGMGFNDIARNIHNATKAPMSRARTIVQTESHRIQQAASYDQAEHAKSMGADQVMQWNSTLDGDTRPTHRKLDGQLRELGEPFEIGGKKARYPGDFGDPAEDCNCRCWLAKRARWALGEDELKTLKDRAKFFGLDKTEDFEDFKEKYLKYSEIPLEKTTKSSKMNVDESAVKDAIESGEVSTTINSDKQKRHIRGSTGYIDGRSYVYGSVEDSQRLVDELSGTGTPVVVNGEWKHKERVTSENVIGVHVDPVTKEETETKSGLIIYSKTGSHIVPRKED